MNITKVTLTGIDNATLPMDLFDLETIYPFVEWGILFSKQQTTNRYPHYLKINHFLNAGLKNISAHLCGGYARDVMEDGNMNFINGREGMPDIGDVDRVQINYNFQRNQKWTFKHILHFADVNPQKSIIFQYNKSNDKALLNLLDRDNVPDNIHILCDASGGSGALINKIRPPFEKYTGYAGGITPDNVDSICANITSADPDDDVWIDMESGVRTNDIFHIRKAESVLKICKKYVP